MQGGIVRGYKNEELKTVEEVTCPIFPWQADRRSESPVYAGTMFTSGDEVEMQIFTCKCMCVLCV